MVYKKKKKKKKTVFIKRKWNHVVFSRATILSFHPVLTTFRWIYPSAFFMCSMSNLGVHTEPRTKPFFLTTGFDCSNSINRDRGQVLSYCKYFLLFLLFLTYCWDWTCNLQMISLLSNFQPNALSTASRVLTGLVYYYFFFIVLETHLNNFHKI